MAEIKNSFLSSKMNQDLDDRLIPNGEYRNALNISIGKSESSDVGTLQNILGNEIINTSGTIITGIECIGYYMDNAGNRIFQFLTNDGNNGSSPVVHQITVYDFNTNTYTVLVEGSFLNFSKLYLITGITLVENLLFWTDHNNQPRKINVTTALNAPASSPSPYYTDEEHISVAKYAPIDPILLYKKVTTTNTAAVPNPGSTVIPVADASGIEVGMTLLGGNYSSNEFVTVESISGNNITVSRSVIFATAGIQLTFLISTMTDESDNIAWPGDPSYLKTKYVRFSYRFKLDDGEYSLMAPFTQIAFIPNQKGYFINGNETDAYTSTVINWFENNVNNVKLLIPFPDLISNVNQSYKIQAVDILYKESDALTVKVLDTVLYTELAQNTLNNGNIYIYDYQSRKPYKTLPTDQITRVYDIVPVKAKAQESSSNRIIYGNFVTGYTAPTSINYQVSINKKQDYSYNFIEYPNHTVKQNRTYQVGFILADKYGRQSSVILSSLDATTTSANGNIYGGSTIYSPYYSQGDQPNIKDWFGDAISVLVNNPIVSNYNTSTGEPGLYATSTSPTGFTLTGTTTITNTTYTFTASAGLLPNVGEFLRGYYTDYVEITAISPDPSPNPPAYGTQYTLTTSGRVSDLYNRDLTAGTDDIKYVYNIIPLGWYSYKVVVRQQEQDYYNVYLPGFLNGYPKGQTYGSQVVYDSTGTVIETKNGINTTVFPTTEDGKVTHTVLINDNINKIPRDLVEVGPDQKLYRSSVQLFGRVENIMIQDSPTASHPYNTQYYPSKKADTAIAIGASTELGFLPQTIENLLGSATYNFYQLETNPLIARISTTNSMGALGFVNDGPFGTYPNQYATSSPDNMVPYLSIYETKPDYSLLDIFWETTTSGLISDLNADILTGYNGANGLSDINWGGFIESLDPADSVSKYITDYFNPISNTGIPVDSTNATLQVYDGYGNPVAVGPGGVFELHTHLNTSGTPFNEYRIFANQYLVFIHDTLSRTYDFQFSFVQQGQTVPTTYAFTEQLKNVAPVIIDLDGNPITSPVNIYLVSQTQYYDIDFPVYTMYGRNGANINAGSSNLKLGLFWKVNDSTSTPGWQNYFDLVNIGGAGQIYQNSIIPIGTLVTLNIELWDGMDSSGVPANGTGLYGSLVDTLTVNIELATTVICDRIWTNINYDGTTYQSGRPIPQAHNSTEWANANIGMWCWPNFEPPTTPTSKGSIYGKMYNGYAIKGIWDAAQPNNREVFAPSVFRIPYTHEMCILNCVEPKNMKDVQYLSPAEGSWLPGPYTVGDSSGFSALPAGWMDEHGTWSQISADPSYGQVFIFWTDDLAGNNQLGYEIIYGNAPNRGHFTTSNLNYGFSVRFVNINTENWYVEVPIPTIIDDQVQVFQLSYTRPNGAYITEICGWQPESLNIYTFSTAAGCSINGYNYLVPHPVT